MNFYWFEQQTSVMNDNLHDVCSHQYLFETIIIENKGNFDMIIRYLYYNLALMQHIH